MSDEARAPKIKASNIRRVRHGHGANCSSVGSVVDALFVTSVACGALLAAIAAALDADNAPSRDDDDRESSEDSR